MKKEEKENREGILKQLPKTKKDSLTLEELQDKLEKFEKTDLTYGEIKKEVQKLEKRKVIENFFDEDEEIKKYFLVNKKNKSKKVKEKIDKKNIQKKIIFKPIKNIKQKIFCLVFLVLSAYFIIRNRFSVSGAIIPLGKVGIRTLPFAIVFFIIGLVFFFVSYPKKKK
ncbi:MAG: hypothetical protein KJ566_00585 [Nanoarchaeota archaeon]|nr:hypothetical protein [Nanoarchaeota archaeon]